MRAVYTVWFRELTLPADDPESEWPACMIIRAASEPRAKAWGDHLAARYSASHRQLVLGSKIEPVECSTLPGLDSLPEIADGNEATDAEIGW